MARVLWLAFEQQHEWTCAFTALPWKECSLRSAECDFQMFWIPISHSHSYSECTPNFGVNTSNSGVNTPNFGVNTPNFGVNTPNSEVNTPE